MNFDEAIDVLRHTAKHNPKALFAHAYRVAWDNPKDAPYVAAILHGLFSCTTFRRPEVGASTRLTPRRYARTESGAAS